ncbi:hypothetical protein BGZ95_010739 [Linnemannia exigua]|uniref:F-box domain-containing protein n=1 Tax=Linnemannia exigua TaxID=604196 RepID=A0AAD4DCN2_9FUNG|nr:hypothetical protein BGZ95_010739 [Linnemannia exigua]
MEVNKHIPEIIQLIGTYLSPPDLYPCIRACRIWYKALTPLLWHTIDDSLYSWPWILYNLEARRQMNDSYEDGRKWIAAVFGKYGHLVRELRVQRREILDVVVGMECCLLLRKFWVGKVESVGLQEVEHEWMYDFSQEEQLEIVEKNTGLRVLRLDESLAEFMDIVTEEYFFETLASLPELVVLENDLVVVDMAVVLDRVPTLTRYAKLSDPISALSLSHTQVALKLTQVELKARPTCWELFKFLRDVPNLDSLRILGLAHVNDQQPCSQEDAALLMDNNPSRLRSIQLEFISDADADLLDIILPWIPHLHTIHLTQLFPKIATAFSTHCPALTTINGDSTGPFTQIIPGRRRPNLQAESLDMMIKTCPNLHKIDWIGHTLYNARIWTDMEVRPWPNLTFLRCQIGGLKVSTIENEPTWRIGRTGPSNYWQKKPFQVQHSIQTQQMMVMHQLGRLIHLKVLDIGADFRFQEDASVVSTGQGDQAPGGGDHSHSRAAASHTKPRPKIYDCLRLSLDMGLGELCELKSLELFGFEGIEHDVGEKEVEWMAEKWPKLKVMRGLNGTLLPKTEEEVKKAHLQSIMRTLRPDVVHEDSEVCVMVHLA